MQPLWFDPAEILIGGQWLPTADRLPVENPSTGETIAEIARGTPANIDAAVTAVVDAVTVVVAIIAVVGIAIAVSKCNLVVTRTGLDERHGLQVLRVDNRNAALLGIGGIITDP